MAKTYSEQPTGSAYLFPSESLPLDGFSRWNDLKVFVPFSRETLRKREIEGRFPRRQHLTQRCAVWPNRELHRWFADPVGYQAQSIDA
ncbi:helix-turn-helix transcriptional regulator [Paraburkholderia dioscoreae]|uniref:Transcriptional regulator n=1 Tax=Paraburkholderia dioscoreae TaxID=2604047 RepID=A0A5Q4ZCE5_9BURK|nr:AlpA family phage regulatory protein [Paraburkholderia dioscoreae]VVD29961.1 Transcriptional regulator [Paraburkholderia dioscoreae]